jgi:hypothetical protein
MAAKVLPHFEVDKDGMSRVFARKGKAFIITELLQNAWDEQTTHVDVSLEYQGDGKARIVVEDDNPDGFADLRHAYTLFAESAKKVDPTKRGRFNLGEKLVIAVCDTACIETTRGTVLFDAKGRRMLEKTRKSGSCFTGTLSMTKAEVNEVEATVATLIPPPGISTTFNFNDVSVREPLVEFAATLRTEIADDEGRLKPTTRKTTVQVYKPLEGEVATLYEMGIPVVPTGDLYHVNIAQKVPLNTDRDNVTPAYLRDVRTLVLNEAHPMIEREAMREQLVTEALQDDKVTEGAVEAVMTARYGEKRVIMDPTDPEANKIAAAAGYTVIPGGALPREAWRHVKEADAALPAGKVTPSPNPEEGAENLKLMNPEHYPDAVVEVVEFAKRYALALLNVDLEVRVAQAPSWPFNATYGRRGFETGLLTLNYGRLGRNWFCGELEPILDLLFDEFGHHYASDHLSRDYYLALRRLGAKAVTLALENPSLFDLRAAVPA